LSSFLQKKKKTKKKQHQIGIFEIHLSLLSDFNIILKNIKLISENFEKDVCLRDQNIETHGLNASNIDERFENQPYTMSVFEIDHQFVMKRFQEMCNRVMITSDQEPTKENHLTTRDIDDDLNLFPERRRSAYQQMIYPYIHQHELPYLYFLKKDTNKQTIVLLWMKTSFLDMLFESLQQYFEIPESVLKIVRVEGIPGRTRNNRGFLHPTCFFTTKKTRDNLILQNLRTLCEEETVIFISTNTSNKEVSFAGGVRHNSTVAKRHSSSTTSLASSLSPISNQPNSTGSEFVTASVPSPSSQDNKPLLQNETNVSPKYASKKKQGQERGPDEDEDEEEEEKILTYHSFAVCSPRLGIYHFGDFKAENSKKSPISWMIGLKMLFNEIEKD
ncbi:hypothetical protein RFI_23295, partial [Reticulomyxa filosa]